MARKVGNGSTAITATAPPTELAVQAAIPPPTMVTAPDAMQFLQQYQAQVGKWNGFQVVDDATYVKAAQGFQEVGAYIDGVEGAFEKACAIPYKAWKAMTDLRGMFAHPAKLVKESLASQQIGWRQKKDADRRAEEQRLQREAEALAEREREALRQQLDRENQARYEEQQAAALALQAERMPWEEEADDIPMPEAPPQVELPPVYVPEVRLPSTVPAVMGLSTRKLPFAGRVIDFPKLIIWLGKQAEAGDMRFLDVICENSVRLNQLAREHTTSLSQILPGVEAFQDETLARR